MATPTTTSSDFYRLLPTAAIYVFYTAVFLTFAPLGLLLGSAFETDRSATAVLFNYAISGMLAVCWAAAFTVSRWFIIGIVVMTIAVMLFSGPLRLTPLGNQSTGGSLETLASVALIAAGYTMFIVFISGRGRETLRLLTEMRLAQQIHETLVPPIEATAGRFEVRGSSHASSEMGGDLIDVVRHGDVTDLYLADVSGHGVRAGVVMGMVKSAIRTRLLAGGDLGAILGDLNRVLHDTTSPEMFVTLACLRVRDDASQVEYGVAGHHPILYYRAETGVMDGLENESLPIGIVDDETYEARTVEAKPGDLFVLYTDGLNECRSAAGVELGHDAVRETVARHAGDSLSAIAGALFEQVATHGPQEDDQTLLLARMNR